jgi:TonB-dependent receptor
MIKHKPLAVISLFIFTLFLLTGSSLRAQSGKIMGSITDVNNGAPMVGANIMLDGTAIGAASDLEGLFHIPQVPVGNYNLTIVYIGYKSKTIPILIKEDETTKLDIQLELDVLEGETITVTAQAQGQMRAINQQLGSNTISNVVSAERIQELPDANAAESVGRLPGISIKRSGGEANQIVIRGLAPTYNTITIGGVKIPSTDLDDRGVDLNMISPEMLSGIEVTKALTPDKDADAFGGIVDFKLATAPEGGFKSNFKIRTSNNAQRDEYGLYKGNFIISNRYNEEKFGIMVSGNLDRAQRGSDQFSADYYFPREKREGEEFAPIIVESVSLQHVYEIRKRLGFSIIMDYRLPNGKIVLNNFMSRLDRDELINQERWNEISNNHEIRFRDRQRQIDVLSNSLSGEHNVFSGELDWQIARTASLTRTPFENYIRTRENSAIDRANFPEISTPDELLAAAFNDYEDMHLRQGDFITEESFERDLNGQLNYKLPYTLNSKVAGYLKFGGKYVDKGKERDRRLSRRYLYLDEWNESYATHHPRYGEEGFEYKWLENGIGAMSNYVDPSFDAGNFLDGRYDLEVAMNQDYLNSFLETYLLDSAYYTSSITDMDDYEVNESVAAGYIMTEINFGRTLMFLTGARYEHTRADMTGRVGRASRDISEPEELDDPFIRDTTAVSTYGRWFPMAHLRYRATDWFDVRLAYTQSLSKPRLSYMLPKRKIFSNEREIEVGRPDLKPQISTNYDIFLSFYGNNIGLFTLGGFYKEIDELIFLRENHEVVDPEEEGLPEDLRGYDLDQAENNPFKTEVRGFEVEWQTHLHWLPSPFDGIVLNVNYTHIWSKTHFPMTVNLTKFVPWPVAVHIDSSRTGRMPDQSDDIANLAIGYDKGPFSGRLSFLYQGNTHSRVGERPELDGFTADLARWDLSIKYNFSDNIGLFFNWNNITNEPDESYQQRTNYLTDLEYYGATMDLGIAFKFD